MTVKHPRVHADVLMFKEAASENREPTKLRYLLYRQAWLVCTHKRDGLRHPKPSRLLEDNFFSRWFRPRSVAVEKPPAGRTYFAQRSEKGKVHSALATYGKPVSGRRQAPCTFDMANGHVKGAKGLLLTKVKKLSPQFAATGGLIFALRLPNGGVNSSDIGCYEH